MKSIFLNDEGRLRAGWRILAFLITTGLLAIVAAVVLSASVGILGLMSSTGFDPFILLVVTAAAQVAIFTGAVVITRSQFDRRSFSSLGLQRTPTWKVDLFAGIALGFVLQALIFAIELAAGWLVVDSPGPKSLGPLGVAGTLLGAILAFALVAWGEELIFRGYLFVNIEEGLDTRWAVVLTSVAFGAVHLVNVNSSPIAAAGIFVAGLMFAAALLATRALWMPIGLHFGWNYAQGPIFGFPVSGNDFGGLISQRPVGPEIVTGGAFGPEAGLLAVAAELLGIALIWLYSRWRGRLPTAKH